MKLQMMLKVLITVIGSLKADLTSVLSQSSLEVCQRTTKDGQLIAKNCKDKLNILLSIDSNSVSQFSISE